MQRPRIVRYDAGLLILKTCLLIWLCYPCCISLEMHERLELQLRPSREIRECHVLAEHGSTVNSARAMTGARETTALPPNSEIPGEIALIQPILDSRDYHAPDDT